MVMDKNPVDELGLFCLSEEFRIRITVILSNGSLWSPNLISKQNEDDMLLKAGLIFVYGGNYKFFLTQPQDDTVAVSHGLPVQDATLDLSREDHLTVSEIQTVGTSGEQDTPLDLFQERPALADGLQLCSVPLRCCDDDIGESIPTVSGSGVRETVKKVKRCFRCKLCQDVVKFNTVKALNLHVRVDHKM